MLSSGLGPRFSNGGTKPYWIVGALFVRHGRGLLCEVGRGQWLTRKGVSLGRNLCWRTKLELSSVGSVPCKALPLSTVFLTLGSFTLPVFRRRVDSPDIARFIQRQSQKPELLIPSRRDTVHNSCGDAVSSRETLQPHCGPDFQGLTRPCCASLEIYQDRRTGF